eukprot:Lankesteria_metandrocarpae@DN2243_c0_g1_i1.p1
MAKNSLNVVPAPPPASLDKPGAKLKNEVQASTIVNYSSTTVATAEKADVEKTAAVIPPTTTEVASGGEGSTGFVSIRLEADDPTHNPPKVIVMETLQEPSKTTVTGDVPQKSECDSGGQDNSRNGLGINLSYSDDSDHECTNNGNSTVTVKNILHDVSEDERS